MWFPCVGRRPPPVLVCCVIVCFVWLFQMDSRAPGTPRTRTHSHCHARATNTPKRCLAGSRRRNTRPSSLPRPSSPPLPSVTLLICLFASVWCRGTALWRARRPPCPPSWIWLLGVFLAQGFAVNWVCACVPPPPATPLTVLITANCTPVCPRRAAGVAAARARVQQRG